MAIDLNIKSTTIRSISHSFLFVTQIYEVFHSEGLPTDGKNFTYMTRTYKTYYVTAPLASNLNHSFQVRLTSPSGYHSNFTFPEFIYIPSEGEFLSIVFCTTRMIFVIYVCHTNEMCKYAKLQPNTCVYNTHVLKKNTYFMKINNISPRNRALSGSMPSVELVKLTNHTMS